MYAEQKTKITPCHYCYKAITEKTPSLLKKTCFYVSCIRSCWTLTFPALVSHCTSAGCPLIILFTELMRAELKSLWRSERGKQVSLHFQLSCRKKSDWLTFVRTKSVCSETTSRIPLKESNLVWTCSRTHTRTHTHTHTQYTYIPSHYIQCHICRRCRSGLL